MFDTQECCKLCCFYCILIVLPCCDKRTQLQEVPLLETEQKVSDITILCKTEYLKTGYLFIIQILPGGRACRAESKSIKSSKLSDLSVESFCQRRDEFPIIISYSTLIVDTYLFQYLLPILCYIHVIICTACIT